MRLSDEPAIPTRVTLEMWTDDGWQPHPAVIANLTRTEVWVRSDEPLGEAVHPRQPVRIVLRRGDGGVRTAETCVLWHIGLDDMLIVLQRPALWDPPSRRSHSRARLAIPVHLFPDGRSRLSARTTNIGVGGFYCVANGAIDAGQRVPVSIRLTPAESFDCLAEVVRVERDGQDEGGRTVELAFRLLELAREDQARLAEALVALSEDVDDNDVPAAWRPISADA
jgi:hypothetical protein